MELRTLASTNHMVSSLPKIAIGYRQEGALHFLDGKIESSRGTIEELARAPRTVEQQGRAKGEGAEAEVERESCPSFDGMPPISSGGPTWHEISV